MGSVGREADKHNPRPKPSISSECWCWYLPPRPWMVAVSICVGRASQCCQSGSEETASLYPSLAPAFLWGPCLVSRSDLTYAELGLLQALTAGPQHSLCDTLGRCSVIPDQQYASDSGNSSSSLVCDPSMQFTMDIGGRAEQDQKQQW